MGTKRGSNATVGDTAWQTCVLDVSREFRFAPPGASSAAIDAGEGRPAADQRGLPHTGLCDLGAFEGQWGGSGQRRTSRRWRIALQLEATTAILFVP